MTLCLTALSTLLFTKASVSDEDSDKPKPARTSLNNSCATSPSKGTIVSKESKSSS